MRRIYVLTPRQKQQLQAKLLNGEYTEDDVLELVLWLQHRACGYWP